MPSRTHFFWCLAFDLAPSHSTIIVLPVAKPSCYMDTSDRPARPVLLSRLESSTDHLREVRGGIYIYICTAGTCFLFITTQPGNSPEDRSAPLRLPIDLLAIDREKGLDERSLMTLSYEKRLRQSMRSESRSFSSRNILYSGDLSIAGRLRAVPIGLADPLVPWKLTTRSDGARGP